MKFPKEVNGYERRNTQVTEDGEPAGGFLASYAKKHSPEKSTLVTIIERKRTGAGGGFAVEITTLLGNQERERKEIFDSKKEAVDFGTDWMRENPDGVDGAATGNGRRTVQDGFGLTGFGTTETGFGDPFGVSNEGDCGCDGEKKEKDPFDMFW